jgi:hypothetical protein
LYNFAFYYLRQFYKGFRWIVFPFENCKIVFLRTSAAQTYTTTDTTPEGSFYRRPTTTDRRSMLIRSKRSSGDLKQEELYNPAPIQAELYKNEGAFLSL